MSHTPGPWNTVSKEQTVVIGGNPAFCVADCGCDRPSRDEDRANARLIAAAPDLLAALKDLLDCVNSDNRVKRGDYYHERKAARAALAKAEGK